MLWLVVVTSIAPLSNAGAMKNNNGEVRIKEKNSISCNCSYIQKHRLGSRLERVRYKRRLYHHNCISHTLSVKDHSEISGFIGAIIENLINLSFRVSALVLKINYKGTITSRDIKTMVNGNTLLHPTHLAFVKIYR